MLHSWESWKPLALLVLLSCTLGRAERKRGRDYGAGGRLLGGGVQGAGGSALPKEPGPSLEQLNVCDLVSHAVLRTLNIYCNCDAREPLNASSATCWLFNEGEKPDSRIWDAFKSQENILQLDVLIRANNSRILNYIPTKGIRHLKKLKVLEILYGNIDVLPKFAFANLTQLQDLSLARNEIMRLEEFSVANLPELIVITLGENRIQEIGKFVFVNLPSLRKLYIDRNNISVIHEGAFAYLENLEELELYQNRISHLTREAFKGLVNLKRLDLHSNMLAELGPEVFAEMPNLDELILDENKIVHVNSEAFEGTKLLTRLNLANNLIRNLDPGVFEDVRKLRIIDLRNNHLRTLTYSTLHPFVENLKLNTSYFFIEGNRFVCDCRLSWVQSLLNETPNEHIRTTLEELECALLDELDHQAEDNGLDSPEKPAHQSTLPVHDRKAHHSASSKYPEQLTDDYDESEDEGWVVNKKPVIDFPENQLPCPSYLNKNADDVSNTLLNSGLQPSTGAASRLTVHFPLVLLVALLTCR
nr:PREDICTED: connectin-like [Bemisia tabaci]